MSQEERDILNKEMVELQRISNNLNKFIAVVGVITITIGIIRLTQ